MEKANLHLDEAYKIVADSAQIGICLMDSNKIKIEGSDYFFKLYGLKKDTDHRRFNAILDRVHPDDRHRLEYALGNSGVDFEPFEIDHRVMTKKGQVRWVRMRGCEMDSTGSDRQVVGFVWDITKAKEANEQLHLSNERYKLLVEGGEELICLYDISGHYLYASPAIHSLLGYHASKIPKKLRSIDLVHPEDKPRFASLWEKAVDSKKEVVSGKFRFKHKAGNYIWCDKNLKAVLDDKENVVAIRSMNRNIEEQVASDHVLNETNRQLEKALSDLKEASQTKESFLSIMSHEIRTPLNSVIGLSNLLANRKPREDQIEVIKTLKHSADSLMHLVNDILDFSKIRSGKVELEILPFSLFEFFQRQHSSFKLSALDKGLELNFQIDPLIPELVEGDETRLNQIFTNLLTNAIKFTHEGYIKLNATLRSFSENLCSILFTVEDTGVGIATDKLESIFTPFHQSDINITRKYGGTGLGLSIVKSLVDLMNGKIGLSSTVGSGSIFSVTIDFNLPIKTYVEELQVTPKENSAPSRIATTKEIQVLYVEDVKSNRFLIENILKDHRIGCVSVSSGKAALRFTMARKFDVMLMDLQMPGIDGFETVKRIRAQENGKNINTNAIAFTAEPYSIELKSKTNQYGFQDILTKPFNQDTLIEKINQAAKVSGTNSNGKLFSFAFYEEAFNHDVKRLVKLKKAVKLDFVRFDKKLQQYDRAKNLTALRTEVHRIRPIVKNLKCEALSLVLDNYRLHDSYNSEVKLITQQSRQIVKKLIGKFSVKPTRSTL
jgi:PAS domain S-box-containing protein